MQSIGISIKEAIIQYMTRVICSLSLALLFFLKSMKSDHIYINNRSNNSVYFKYNLFFKPSITFFPKVHEVLSHLYQ